MFRRNGNRENQAQITGTNQLELLPYRANEVKTRCLRLRRRLLALGGLPMRSRYLIGLLVLAGLLIPASAAAEIAEGQAALNYLNQQRAANGIPLLTSLNQSLAAWCPNEQAYSPTIPAQVEAPGAASSWGNTETPWDIGPLHQTAIYDPQWNQGGFVNTEGAACAGFSTTGGTQPAQPTFYNFISDGGTSNVPPAETVSTNEDPFSPQQLLLNIGPCTATGPQMVLYALGFPKQQTEGTSDLATPVEGSLHLEATATGTPVSVALLTSSFATQKGYPGSLADDAIAIPPEPLAANTQYSGQLTWQGPDGTTATQQFNFTTGNARPAPEECTASGPEKPSPALRLKLRVKRHLLKVAVSTAPGVKGQIKLNVRHGRQERHLHLTTAGRARTHLSTGHWSVTASFIPQSGDGSKSNVTRHVFIARKIR